MVDTLLNPHTSLDRLLGIETKLGRVRNDTQWSNRVIDIDIIFYNDEIIKTDNLIIPHKETANRKFVLIPLNEIANNFVHPEIKVTISDLLLKCTDTSEVVVFKEER